MKDPVQSQKHQVIVNLEQVKKDLLKTTDYQELVQKIDNSLQLIYQVSDHTLSHSNEVLLKLQPTITYLREMRHQVLETRPKTTIDYGHEVNLGIGMVQFELWDHSKQELYDLLDGL